MRDTMPNNQALSGRELVLEDDMTIVSTTDLRGNINYANPYFIAVSGYSEQELMGAPQSILRHPDMPAEAFADLWATIQSGQSWTGMVKNRCKNGDFYWVLANVTPVIERGKPVGYMSVRTKPGRAQVSQAEALYRRFKSGQAGGLRLVSGHVEHRGLRGRLRALGKLSLARQVALNGVLLTALPLLALLLLRGEAARGWLVAALLLSAALAPLFCYGLQRNVVEPLRRATSAASRMAGGDLTVELGVQRDDDMGRLLAALRQTNINLHSIIADVRGSFEQIDIATNEIANGNMDLSGRTESQASSLQETAASMEQLTSTVQQSADSMASANDLACQASRVAERGGSIVSQVVSTMDEISGSSHRIRDIIGLIDGIAFQTNILALNAAVEAARAGEDGRGFAVVAGEVRNLAQRSASAAQEIKQLITLSIEKVNAGSALSSSAGTVMTEVIASVGRVSNVMEAMSNCTREQSHGLGQVNQAVIQIDDITQQNAALVEQSAAAAGSLAQQTRQVAQALAVFKLRSAPGARGGRAARA